MSSRNAEKQKQICMRRIKRRSRNAGVGQEKQHTRRSIRNIMDSGNRRRNMRKKMSRRNRRRRSRMKRNNSM